MPPQPSRRNGPRPSTRPHTIPTNTCTGPRTKRQLPLVRPVPGHDPREIPNHTFHRTVACGDGKGGGFFASRTGPSHVHGRCKSIPKPLPSGREAQKRWGRWMLFVRTMRGGPKGAHDLWRNMIHMMAYCAILYERVVDTSTCAWIATEL